MSNIEAKRVAGLLRTWGFREIEYVRYDGGGWAVSAVGDMGFRQVWHNLSQVRETAQNIADARAEGEVSA